MHYLASLSLALLGGLYQCLTLQFDHRISPLIFCEFDNLWFDTRLLMQHRIVDWENLLLIWLIVLVS